MVLKRILLLCLLEQMIKCAQKESVHLSFRKIHLVLPSEKDRKSTRLNSSHVSNSYAVVCLKQKNDLTTTSSRIYSRIPPPAISPLFPYTTLFRSRRCTLYLKRFKSIYNKWS